MECQTPLCFWERIALMPISELSVLTQYGSVLVGIVSEGAEMMISLSFWKASWHSGVHSNSFLTNISAFNGHAIWAKFCTKCW